ncbi:hypothetical protein DKX38_029328 [Salix brachista]|uniref:Uncharacterized protein n=1 Tax=Salix brachista TaxID=2182728 RepID=A0A5N5J2D7_9ROSI|nr:hypothetical protein DKX38_029328 [Salix brachista]
MRTTPPSLLSLAIDTAILHISTFSDLSFIPDHIILDLFLVLLFSSFLPSFIFQFSMKYKHGIFHIYIKLTREGNSNEIKPFRLWRSIGERTLKAGKLTEKVLKLFVATGNDEVLAFIHALNIQHVVTPVLPTSESYLKNFHSILPEVLS